MLRGIKRSQGSPAAQPFQLLTAFFLVIHQALDLNSFDHCAFWAACMLGYFGFLHAAEITAPNLASFSPFIYQWQTSQWIHSSHQPASVFG